MKAIIFDCYGVLVGKGFWATYRMFGGDVQKDDAFITQWLNELDLNKISYDKFCEIMAERLNTTASEFGSVWSQDEVANEDMFDFIRTELVSKYKLAIVSNATSKSVRKHIDADKMALFDEVFISGEVGLVKPDPKLFNLALSKLGVKAEEAVFVDDHQKYVDGAKAVGINAILFNSIDDFKQQLAKLTK